MTSKGSSVDRSGANRRMASRTVSVGLARRLQAAGLHWRPGLFDFFHIPDRHLDDEIFVIADLSVDVQRLGDGIAAITFNGAVEWSLDYILQQDVVWLPTESQLREMLGDALVALRLEKGGWVCVAVVDGPHRSYEAVSAADAYGLALLDRLSG